MLVARLELWKQGSPYSVEVLDTIVIANDSIGTAEKGNYNYAISHEDRAIRTTARGSLRGWDRGRSALELLVKILRKEGWG